MRPSCNNDFLVNRMNSMGMTTYMYAPKDDAKHRAFWRDLYSVEEAGNFKCTLMQLCCI